MLTLRREDIERDIADYEAVLKRIPLASDDEDDWIARKIYTDLLITRRATLALVKEREAVRTSLTGTDRR